MEIQDQIRWARKRVDEAQKALQPFAWEPLRMDIQFLMKIVYRTLLLVAADLVDVENREEKDDDNNH